MPNMKYVKKKRTDNILLVIAKTIAPRAKLHEAPLCCSNSIRDIAKIVKISQISYLFFHFHVLVRIANLLIKSQKTRNQIISPLLVHLVFYISNDLFQKLVDTYWSFEIILVRKFWYCCLVENKYVAKIVENFEINEIFSKYWLWILHILSVLNCFKSKSHFHRIIATFDHLFE